METRHDQLTDQCRQWHKENPQVWILFERFTFDRINRGFEHYSAQAIWERIRWETGTGADSSFKLNNNYRGFYARAFEKMHPEHEGFFRKRVQTSKHEPAVDLPPLRPEDFD